MLHLLIDQDLDHDILRGLIRRIPQLDAVTAFEIGMSEATDPQLLIRAAQEGRIIITHDRKTMPAHAADLIGEGENIAGLFVVPRSMPLHQALEDLELMITCSENEEWVNVIRYLPF
jgi:predicted nuclease of predicted toxin-antitoxin system